ncbi:hypothetical protein [Actinokineospora globicatena]|uniref:hypothetical protein n=1 Tax=Actinokineospora globicatena TaxID=103729 RepID=UPI0020A3121D|nr:hypothetical protein [Actinokineospora globicatena]MCP2304222.1 hypothetical protein [Actinokineospora globicatena]
MSDPYYQVDPLTGRPVAYQGFGMYEPPPPPPRKTPLYVFLALLLVVALGVVFMVIKMSADDAEPLATTAQTPPPTTSRSATTRSTTTTSPMPASARIAPTIPGWQGVLSPKEKAAYDVPQDWKVETPGTVVGFDDHKGTLVAVMHGATTYVPEACPDSRSSYRGHAGFVTAGATDPERAAVNGVRLFADAAALNKDDTRAPVSSTAPKPVKVANGTIDAITATATVTPTHPSECPSPTILFTSVAFKHGTTTILFLMYQDQGVPDTLPQPIADQIITTIRPV